MLVVDSHVLKYVDRTASGTLPGKKVCCACESEPRETKRMTVERRDEKGQLDSMNETRMSRRKDEGQNAPGIEDARSEWENEKRWLAGVRAARSAKLDCVYIQINDIDSHINSMRYM